MQTTIDLSQKPTKFRFSQKIMEDLKPLYKLDNWHGIVALLRDFAVIAASISLTQFSWYFYIPAVVIIGSQQRALATIVHESAHKVLAANKYLNDILGYFAGWLIVQKLTSYRNSHAVLHHNNLGTDKDPDFNMHQSIGMYDPELSSQGFVWQHILQPLLLLKVLRYLKYLIEYRLLGTGGSKIEGILMPLFWVVLLVLAHLLGFWQELILFWVVPFLTTYQIVGWFNELCEHFPFAGTTRDELRMSRNRHSPWYESFLFNTHNENFHLVHHLNVAIPFWNMSKANDILRQNPEYAAQDDLTGGIFVSTGGRPSIISSMIFHVRERYEQHQAQAQAV